MGSATGIELPEGDPGAVEDAAAGLRRIGGGFAHTGGVAERALGSVPSWVGAASVSFQERCTDYSSAARAADTACGHAARALVRYAGVLEEARDRVKILQNRAEGCLDRIRIAETRASEANTRADGLDAEAYLADFNSPLDAGTTASSMRQQADDARAEAAAAAQEADRARDELHILQDEARDEKDRVKRAGETAASAVRGAAGGLPSPSWAGASLGGTVTGSRGEKTSVAVRILIFTIGGSESALVEEHADGTWTVTTAEGLEGGIKANLKPGVDADTSHGGKGPDGKTGRLGGGPDLEAALLAQYEHGKTYEFTSEAAAMAFLRTLKAGEPQQVYGTPYGAATYPDIDSPDYARWLDAKNKQPDETYQQGGLSFSAGARFETEGDASAKLSIGGSEALGVRTDEESGARTEYFKSSVSASGDLSVPGAHAGGKLEGESVTSLTRDADGDPASFSISSSASADASAGLQADLKDGNNAVGVGADSADATRHERQVTLDLSDPSSRAAVERYLDSGGYDPDAVAALNERLREHGDTVLRTYAVGTDSQHFSADAKVVGVEVKHETSSSRLVSLQHRPPGADDFTRVVFP